MEIITDIRDNDITNRYVEPEKPKIREKVLLAALLVRAIRDLRSARRFLSKDAEEWFHGDSRDVFSFHWVCENLGLDAKRILSEL